MDAPIYPPATEFEPPAKVRTELSIYNVSSAEMIAVPKAWEIVVKYEPMLKRMSAGGGLGVHLSNLTVPNLLAFSNQQNSPEVRKMDEEFRALPDTDKPAQ